MNMKHALVGIAGGRHFDRGRAVLARQCLCAGFGQGPQVAWSLLKSEAAKLGAPKVSGTDTVAGQTVPALYFGSTKIDNNYDRVDNVVKQMGGTATIFGQERCDYVRVSTNVPGPSGRATGPFSIPRARRSCHQQERSVSTARAIFSANPTSRVTSRSTTVGRGDRHLLRRLHEVIIAGIVWVASR